MTTFLQVRHVLHDERLVEPELASVVLDRAGRRPASQCNLRWIRGLELPEDEDHRRQHEEDDHHLAQSSEDQREHRITPSSP